MSKRIDDIQRQIELIALIESRPDHYSEEDLAEHLCVSLSMLRRDMKALRDLGITIRSRKRTCNAELSNDDLNFLVTTYFAFGNQERIKNLPAVRRKMKQQTLLFFIRTMKAIESKKMMEIDYKSKTQPGAHWRTIAPLAFYNAGKAHYLIALHGNIPKIFTLERIRAFRTLNESSGLKNVPSVSELFRYSWGSFTGGNVTVVKLLFQESFEEYITDKHWIDEQSVQKTEDGILVTMKVRLSNEFIAWLMGWGSAVRVLEPPELIDQVIKKTAEIQELYKSQRHRPEE